MAGWLMSAFVSTPSGTAWFWFRFEHMGNHQRKEKLNMMSRGPREDLGASLWADGRQPFRYRIMEGLPVIQARSAAVLRQSTSKLGQL
jgi:hypothetical protein